MSVFHNWLLDLVYCLLYVLVLHPTGHTIGHFGTSLSRQSIALVLTRKQKANNTQHN